MSAVYTSLYFIFDNRFMQIVTSLRCISFSYLNQHVFSYQRVEWEQSNEYTHLPTRIIIYSFYFHNMIISKIK